MAANYHNEFANVVEADEAHVWISAVQKSSCDSCSTSNTCGTGILSKVFGRQLQLLKLENTIGAKSGDEVIVQVPNAGLLLGSSVIYLVPIVFLFVGAVFTEALLFSEGIVVVGGVLGFILGLGTSKLLTQKLSRRILNEIKLIAFRSDNIVLQIESH
ncbi:SoxR reducing system RseC family protein [Pleionea sediminis]|uniref:SoxR reducing system RseC family protein n=1 Tax=Pleionea sediminis TaxID=2569479 RepID=UPI001184CACF|nr:SoxR reducing system RseC family protein [Pleionea sediminis]